MKINLSSPINWKNTQVSSLDLELESLTGRDLIDAESALKAKGINISAWEYSRQFLLELAALSCHIPADALLSMKAADFTRVTQEVMSFLAEQVSSDNQLEA